MPLKYICDQCEEPAEVRVTVTVTGLSERSEPRDGS